MKVASDMASYFAVSRTGLSAGREGVPSVARAAGAAAGADTVTISSAAREAAAAETAGSKPAAESPSLTYRQLMLRNAQADPAFAKKAAHEFAHDDSYVLNGPMVDISHDPIRYSATGEVVTEESLAAFKSQARQARDELIALYQSEKGKGTPDAEILEKLFRARDGQPNEYLQKLNWARVGA